MNYSITQFDEITKDKIGEDKLEAAYDYMLSCFSGVRFSSFYYSEHFNMFNLYKQEMSEEEAADLQIGSVSNDCEELQQNRIICSETAFVTKIRTHLKEIIKYSEDKFIKYEKELSDLVMSEASIEEFHSFNVQIQHLINLLEEEDYEESGKHIEAAIKHCIESTEETIYEIEQINESLAEKLRTDLSTIIEQESDLEDLDGFRMNCVDALIDIS